MSTANERYRDFLIRRQIMSLRYRNGVAERFNELLDSTELEIVGKIRAFMDANGTGDIHATRAEYERLGVLLAEIRDLRVAASSRAVREISQELREYMGDEARFTIDAFERAVGLQGVTLAPVAIGEIATFADRITFGSKPLSELLARFQDDDANRVVNHIANAWREGQTPDQVVRSLRGTRAAKYRDGITAISRRSAASLVRTAVTTITTAARESIWQENSDIIIALQWSSILDGRTSQICQSRDGRMALVGGDALPEGARPLDPPGARPPAHPSCRSIMIPVIDGVAMIGDRTTIRDIRTRRVREIDFARESRRRGVPIQQIRAEWAAEYIGSVPHDVYYPSWIRTQSAAFQDEVYGPTRGALLRRGGLDVDDFVDQTGKRYTLDELRSRHGAAFDLANLN